MAGKHRSIPDLTKQDVLRFWSKVRIREPDECWPWTASGDKNGYGQFGIGSRVTLKMFRAHRVAWTIASGPIPIGLCVLHSCDNPTCQNPRHFFCGTVTDNNHDMMQKGRYSHVRGEQSETAKLTENQVREIRRRYASGKFSQHSIAREYHVDQANIWRIVHRQKWTHVA